MQISDTFAKVVGVSLAVLLIVAGLLFVGTIVDHPVYAQNSGTVGILAKLTPVFSAQAANGSSGGTWQCGSQFIPSGTIAGACGFLPDVGQGTQVLFFCNNNFSGTIDLEWSPTITSPTFFPLTQSTYANDGPSSGTPICHQLPLNAYWPNLRATISGFSSGKVSAWYSQVSGPTQATAAALGTGGATSPISCDLTGTETNVTNGTTAFLGGVFNAGDQIVICGVTISLNGAATSGSIQIGYSPSNACATMTPTFFNVLTTSATPQIFSVPLYQYRNLSVTANQSLCIVNNSGTTIKPILSYASIHGL